MHANVPCLPACLPVLSRPPNEQSGGRYEALIDVPSRVFDVDFVRALRELGATSTLRYIVITRLTPERLPVLARVLAACEQQGLQVGKQRESESQLLSCLASCTALVDCDACLTCLTTAAACPLQLLLSNPALRLLNERAEADEALASALRNVQLEAVSRGSEIFLSQRGQVRGRRLRFIPIPTPRWPDLLAVHSEEGEQRCSPTSGQSPWCTRQRTTVLHDL